MRAALALLLVVPLLSGCFGARGVQPDDLLTDGTYKTWVVEVDAAAGYRPSTALLSFLTGKLSPLVHKDDLHFEVDDALPAEDKVWTNSAILAESRARQDLKTEGSQVVTHLMFLAGRHEQQGVLGVAFDHELVAIFPQQIQDACSNPLVCNSVDSVTRAVTLHEMGHILGLVDNGVAMVEPHEASSCGNQPDKGHSSNTQSVMYCQVETVDILALLSNGPPQDFDARDRADLRAAGGR